MNEIEEAKLIQVVAAQAEENAKLRAALTRVVELTRWGGYVHSADIQNAAEVRDL